MRFYTEKSRLGTLESLYPENVLGSDQVHMKNSSNKALNAKNAQNMLSIPRDHLLKTLRLSSLGKFFNILAKTAIDFGEN